MIAVANIGMSINHTARSGRTKPKRISMAETLNNFPPNL